MPWRWLNKPKIWLNKFLFHGSESVRFRRIVYMYIYNFCNISSISIDVNSPKIKIGVMSFFLISVRLAWKHQNVTWYTHFFCAPKHLEVQRFISQKSFILLVKIVFLCAVHKWKWQLIKNQDHIFFCAPMRFQVQRFISLKNFSFPSHNKWL